MSVFDTKVSGSPITHYWMNAVQDALGAVPEGESYPELPTCYVVWTDGTYYYARNGHTGALDFGGSGNAGGVDGTSKLAVQQATVNVLETLGGGTIYLKGMLIDVALTYSEKIWIQEDYQGSMASPYQFPYSCIVHKPDPAVEYYEAYKNIGRKYTILKRAVLLQDIFTKVLDEFKTTGANVKLKLGSEDLVRPDAGKPLWSYDCAGITKNITFEGLGDGITGLGSKVTGAGNTGVLFYDSAGFEGAGWIKFKDLAFLMSGAYIGFRFDRILPLLDYCRIVNFEPLSGGRGFQVYSATGGPTGGRSHWNNLAVECTETGTPASVAYALDLYLDYISIDKVYLWTNGPNIYPFRLNCTYGHYIDELQWLIWGAEAINLVGFTVPTASHQRPTVIQNVNIAIEDDASTWTRSLLQLADNDLLRAYIGTITARFSHHFKPCWDNITKVRTEITRAWNIDFDVSVKPVSGKIALPFDNTAPAVITAFNGVNANPTASTDYHIVEDDIILESLVGTDVVINIYDEAGNLVRGPVATLSPWHIPVHYYINFGAFSVTPNVKVYRE